jgi:formylglycine-generating enzyme required for sulfatase activity
VTNPTGPSDGSVRFRVNRGGGWSSGGAYCRAAYRTCNAPGFRISTLGFRLARSVPSAGT